MDSSKKVYLIDLDGTLLKAKPFLFFSANTFLILKNFFPKVGIIGIFRVVLPSLKYLLKNPYPNKTNLQALRDSLKALSGEDLDDVLWNFYRKDFPKLQGFCSPVPHAKERILELKRKGHALYLTTNPIWPLECVERRLRWADLDPALFLGITHSENWYSCKPHVRYYQEVLERWNLKASDCILIGDSEEKEGPARRLGIEVKIIPAQNQKKFWELA